MYTLVNNVRSLSRLDSNYSLLILITAFELHLRLIYLVFGGVDDDCREITDCESYDLENNE